MLSRQEWTDAQGTVNTGQTQIPAGADDTTTPAAAFPSGSVRFKNVMSYQSATYDATFAVSATPLSYATTQFSIAAQYAAAGGTTSSAQLIGASGLGGVGVSIPTSTCASGAAIDATAVTCPDGSVPTVGGTEFTVSFVVAGTETAAPNFDAVWFTIIGEPPRPSFDSLAL